MPRLSRRASPRRHSRSGDRSLRRLRGEGRWGRRGRVARRGDRSVSPSPYLRRPAAGGAGRAAARSTGAGWGCGSAASGRGGVRAGSGRAGAACGTAAQGAGARASAESGTGGRGSALAEKSSAPADRASGGRGARARPRAQPAEGRCATAPCDQSGREARAEARPAPGDPAGEGAPDQAGAGDMSGEGADARDRAVRRRRGVVRGNLAEVDAGIITVRSAGVGNEMRGDGRRQWGAVDRVGIAWNGDGGGVVAAEAANATGAARPR